MHDAYFDVYTVPSWQLPAVLNGTQAQMTAQRVTADEHASRMETLAREYLSTVFQCLPASTLVVLLAPFHSTKAPWEAPLVQATYRMLGKLFEEGWLLQRGILFLDTWYMSVCGGSRTTDGNHYEYNMQTAVWWLLTHALTLLKRLL